jgi:L-2-hydroxyglutarate oxidase
VALDEAELPALAELERRGAANGLTGIRRIEAAEIREIEPHCAGVAGLCVPQTGIVDFIQAAETMARLIRERGGEIQLNTRLIGTRRDAGSLVLETTQGIVRCRHLINCAGLQCDRVARLCGMKPDMRIIPFRGEYYQLAPERRAWVRNLIYPVPDPRFPFLGVHFTRMIDGGVEAGPNAVLAFRREGYSRFSFSPRDMAATLGFPGFWRMAAKHWRMGLGEFHRSFSKRAFVRALRLLMPDLQAADLAPGGAGVRAQAVGRDGKLLDDFRILQDARMIHVLNAPSPAATASLAIGERIADMADKSFELR